MDKIWQCKCACHFDKGMKHCVACCSECPKCGRRVKIGMENLHAEECQGPAQTLTPEERSFTFEEQAVIDEAQDLMEKVLARITQSTKQYGTNYVLADVMKETDEEMLDIIGWPLLEVIRMRQLFLKKLGQLDGKYLDKFLGSQTFEYLSHLKEKIDAELVNRQ